MGLSSSTTKVEPWKQAQAPIMAANSAVAGTYGANSGKIQGYADQIGGLIPSMVAKYQQGDQGINAARDWMTNTLQGNGTNPNLQAMIDQSGNDMARSINANMGTRGLTGGSVQQHILGKELSNNATGLRYQDWLAGQQRQMQAAGMAPGLAAADTIQIAPLLAAAQAAGGLPMDAASQYAGATGGLLGQYTTTKQSQPWGQALLGAAANGIGAFAGGGGFSGGSAGGIGGGISGGISGLASMFSDERLKEDIRRVGQTDGGLPVYTYRYKGEKQVQMGTMAHHVAQTQPDALGPVIGGYMTVNYGEVR